MKAGTRRGLAKLMSFFGLMMVCVIIYGTILYGLEYLFGYWVGIAFRVMTIVVLAVCLGYLTVKAENEKEEKEK